MTTRTCHPLADDHMPCGVALDRHGDLTPTGFVHPPYPCVADHRVTHDEDGLNRCVHCLPPMTKETI